MKNIFSSLRRGYHFPRKPENGSHALQKIVAIKASINRGLSEQLKIAFPDITPIFRLSAEAVFKYENFEYTHWLAGFSSGEASFIVKIKKSFSHRSGFQVLLCFSITQHSRDEQLMKDLMEYFDCGRIYKKKNKEIFLNYK